MAQGSVEHTPGPWESARAALTGPAGEGHNFSNGDWEVYPPLGEAGPVAICPNEADARLVAAAPDLLDALQKLLPLAEVCLPAFLDSYTALDKARVAIAQATGRPVNS